MKPSEIKLESGRLERRLTDLGFVKPQVYVNIGMLFGKTAVSMNYRISAEDLSPKYEFIYGEDDDDFDVLFEKADKYIDGLTPIVEQKRDAFLASVGRLIDAGREIGIDVEFLNPLTDMMKKLSANIITHQP